MKRSPITLTFPLPPLLSMDEYADFVETSLRESDPVRAAKQKALEERILMPFCLMGKRRPQMTKKKRNGCIESKKIVHG